MSDSVQIFGVRHHGPGSARAVLRRLEATRPACVLVEGPPDADAVIPLLAHADMRPPVALLVYQTDRPSEAAFYPMVEFSPEYVALRWAIENDVPTQFMDLPQSMRMGVDGDEATENAERVRVDPLGALAKAAGYDDGERWWEAAIETRHAGDEDIFALIHEAMTAVREANPDDGLRDDPVREAFMRTTIRKAQKEHGSLAVICGAWHAPVLDLNHIRSRKKDDAALLKPLAKVKTTATWVPWTYDRLAFASGYGAGVLSPGWYDHLWHAERRVVEGWLTKAARLFRDEGIDCSSAHVIEATRLAGTLSAMRGRHLPDLADIADATRSVFCFDSDLGMRLIERKLIVGERIGEVPDDAPAVPLQKDLQQSQKSLRLKPTAEERLLELDVRKENDLARSHLLHRLAILQVPWGTADYAGGKGTFKEAWRLRWEPAMLVRLIELSRYGSTVRTAASAFLLERAREEHDLSALADVVGDTLLANLPEAVDPLVGRLLDVAAVGADAGALMRATPPLANTLRYGNVRKTDADVVRAALEGILPRAFAGFAGASSNLDHDAAAAFEQLMIDFDRAVRLVDEGEHRSAWQGCLRRCAASDTGAPGLIRGRCARLLFDADDIDVPEVERLLGRALSRGNDPADAAGWVEGFLRDSGLLLLHDARLLSLIDTWVCDIAADGFDSALPLIRRTFGTFEPAERRQLGEQLRAGAGDTGSAAAPAASINVERAAKVMPTLAAIFGRTL